MSMKLRLWNELKCLICPLKNWQPDSRHKKCQCCSKDFTFYRRRHHCRFCGKIYCSQCSDFYINGKYLNLDEKYVRHCDFCKEGIDRIRRDLNKLLFLEDEEEEADQEDYEDEEYDDEVQYEDQNSLSLRFFFSGSEQYLTEKLDIEIKEFLKDMFRQMLYEYRLEEQPNSNKLFDILIRAVLEAKLTILPKSLESTTEDYMDITRNIKIKANITPEYELVKGIVIYHGLILKKSLPTISNPVIILIKGSRLISNFEEILSKDERILSNLQQKIMKLNPDIIFLTGSIDIDCLKYFDKFGVNVVTKCSWAQIEEIKNITGIRKVIENIWNIEKYKKRNILGECERMYLKSNAEGLSMIYLEKKTALRTILITERTEQSKIALKKIIKSLLKSLRQLYLEKYVIYQDNQVLEELDFDVEINEKMPLRLDFKHANPLRNNDIVFNKIFLSKFNLEGMQKKRMNLGSTAIEQFCQICGEIEEKTKKRYGEGDVTIGFFLVAKAASFLKICENCNLPHKQRLYFSKNCVELQIEKQKRTNQKSKFSFKSEEQSKNIACLSKLKETSIILHYFYCESCEQQVSKHVKVSNNFLKNSYYHFLSMLSSIPKPQIARKSSRTMLMEEEQENKCDHRQLVRLFEFNGLFFKFKIEPLAIHQVSYINLVSEFSIILVNANLNKILKQKHSYDIETCKELLTFLLLKIEFYSSFISNYKNSIRNTRFEQQLQGLYNLKKVLSKLQTFIAYMVGTQSFKDQYKLGVDWSYKTRDILKIEYIIKTCIEIVLFMEQQFQKHRVESDDLITPSIIESCENQEDEKESSEVIEEGSHRINYNIFRENFREIQNDSTVALFMKSCRKRRFPLKKGIFRAYHSCQSNNPVSIIAACINSHEFNELLSKNEFGKEIKLSLSLSKEIKTSFELKQQIDKLKPEDKDFDPEEKKQSVDLVFYYHEQFEQIRQIEGLPFQDYAVTLCGCEDWETSGGKSKATFWKSFDQRVVIKAVKEKEFEEFLKFAPEYIKYIKNMQQHEGSLLAKIFGLYSVSMRGVTYKCVIMENLFFGMTTMTKVYDLKGSLMNRLNIQSEGLTGLDTNFKIDRNFHPYIVEKEEYNRISKMTYSDAKFLKDYDIIDYSLLVIEDREGQLRLGIIDFMRPYHIFQKVEYLYKNLNYKEKPTVVNPKEYADRFCGAYRRYFMKRISLDE